MLIGVTLGTHAQNDGDVPDFYLGTFILMATAFLAEKKKFSVKILRVFSRSSRQLRNVSKALKFQ